MSGSGGAGSAGSGDSSDGGGSASTAVLGDESSRERDRLRLSRALFPALAASLDAALERATGFGAAPSAAFDTRLDAEAAERFAGAGLAELSGRAGGSRLERAFLTVGVIVRECFEVPGLALPEPESFAASGVDLARLAELLEADPALAPVPAPHGLGAEAWQAAFRAASLRPGSPFAADPGPLVLAAEVAREFGLLDLAPSDPGGQVPVAQNTATGAVWTLRLIPASPEPETLGLNFTHSAPHATLPEMLMLQLMRAIEGEAPLDGGDGRGSFTWLAGMLAEGRLAARHVYDAGSIRITAREIGSQGPHLGARSPRA
ncbi:hypothetical protein LEUCIP111803_00039 [Leucobacter soli]|uniref:Uncharacterized protein n=1 Tax=Leucobacter soli TaxID=2812850 RepID=A0A916JQR4_9MICO|nr:hypothetical protein [Leucobacter soli]CAG7595361.1 hypothetical protein LEUCIP111803_00039 [Leucobacter soli]